MAISHNYCKQFNKEYQNDLNMMTDLKTEMIIQLVYWTDVLKYSWQKRKHQFSSVLKWILNKKIKVK